MLNNDYINTQLGLLPKEWEVVSFGEICDVFSGYGFKSKDYKKVGIPLIKIGNLQNKRIVLSDDNDFIAYDWQNTAKLKKYILKPGDILIALTGATTGKVARMGKNLQNCFLNQRVGKVEKLSKRCHIPFVYFYIQSKKFQNEIILGIRKSAQGNVSPTKLKSIPIALPPLPEQHAIAHALSTVRDAIEATEGVIAAARELKRSMMMHLFTYGPVPVHEADQVPLKETEIGEIPEAWEVRKIGELADVNYGKGNPKSDGSIPVVGSGGIYDWTDEPLVIHPTIIIGRKGTAGRAWLMEEPSYPSDTTFYLDWKMEVNIKFLSNYLSLRPLSGEHAKTTIPSLTRSDLENKKVCFPPLLIQNTISDKISIVENKIMIEGKNKTALEGLFNSLLHHLMTGKVRVEYD